MPRRPFVLLVLPLLLGAGCDSASDPADLAGTRWRLVAADVQGEDRPPHNDLLAFERGGEVGITSCNTCGGRYAVDASWLRFEGVACTEIYCADRLDLGPLLGQAERGRVDYQREGDRLTLRFLLRGGEVGVLRFERAE